MDQNDDSQNFDPYQDYYPSFENHSNSDELPNTHFDMNSQIPSTNTPQNTSENTSNAPKGWSSNEDVALMSAYCFVSTNAIVGTNQKDTVLWKKVHNQYIQTPGITGRRTVNSLRQRYIRLNKNVTAWVGAYTKAYGRKKSGESNEDIEKTAQAFYGNTKFTHHEVFERVMRHYPKWELKLDDRGCTRYQPDDDTEEESRGSSKRSRTDEDGNFATESTPESNGSEASTLHRPTGRDQAKAKAKRRGKEKASQSSFVIPDDFTAELREMRLTREKEIGMQERKMKTSTLNTLMSRSQLSPEEEALKRHLIAELYPM